MICRAVARVLIGGGGGGGIFIYSCSARLITSGRYDTGVINSVPLFSCFFSILCRAARVVEEPAEEMTTSGIYVQLPENFKHRPKMAKAPKLSLHKIRQNC